jgi:hypothetical protein
LPTDNTWTGINTFNNDVVINESGTSDALRITNTGTGNSLLVEDSANPDSNPFVITATGNVIVGSITANLGISATAIDTYTGIISNARYASPSYQQFVRANGTIASPTSVSSGDPIGQISFQGFDGTVRRTSAVIEAAADGAPVGTSVPGRLVFFTTLSGGGNTERMRIDSNGNVFIGFPITSGQNTGGLTIQGKDIELMTIMDAY